LDIQIYEERVIEVVEKNLGDKSGDKSDGVAKIHIVLPLEPL
jgi:hypothetical protein